MSKKEKAPQVGSNPLVEDKDTKRFQIKATISALFSTGLKLTAKEINERTRCNDARKYISDLRKQGMKIESIRLSSGCKLYWLAEDRQLNLFVDNSDNKRACKTQRIGEVVNGIREDRK